MASVLGIAFAPSEVTPLRAICQALDAEYDVLLLSGEPAEGSGRTLAAHLDEIPPADNLDRALADFCRPYAHVAFVSSMRAKDYAPRLAARLDGVAMTDVVSVEAKNRFVRPMVAGAVLATIETQIEPVILTARPAGFLPAQGSPTESTGIDLAMESRSQVTQRAERSGGRPDLSQAKVIVSGGRPLKDAETFERIVGGLADALHGAVGATRAAVDAGIAPNELQVGQTGKIVAPDLYIAAGISGSTQHMAGIKDSKVIVAINKDPDAPIFESATFGLVSDLFEALPELQSRLAP